MNEKAESSSELFYDIMHNLSEGVITVSPKGVITYINPAGRAILDLKEDILGKKFSECFLEQPGNAGFVDSFMDAVYARAEGRESIVSYRGGKGELLLRLVTSYLVSRDGNKYGMMGVFSDLSMLAGLSDAVRAAERIGKLNRELHIRNELLRRTFGRYLSNEVVHELIDKQGGLAIGGKNRLITILMSDLRGFTALCEKLEPACLVEMLNHYLGMMIDIIEGSGGTIIEIMGDGILAIFGAPGENENHAADAVAAALRMQSEMPGINQWNREKGYPPLQMGIGINTGEAVVGNIGSERRTRFNVIGSQVNLCGRIESYTTDGQVLISASTKQYCRPRLSFSGTMTVHPKGVEEELLLYQVLEIGEPYNVKGRCEVYEPKPLKEPIPVCFYQIREKHETEKPCFGGITALSLSGAVLDTETGLSEYEDISILIGERISFKVMEKREDGYLLSLTAVPLNYTELLEQHGIL